MTDGPIIGGGLWRTVVASCGGMCMCAGWCGLTHKKSFGRCDRMQRPGESLHAVPREPVSDIRAMTLKAGDLWALCADCHGRLIALRRREERAAAAKALKAAPPLWESVSS